MPPWTDRVSRFTVGVWLAACTVGVVQAQLPEPACDSDSRCQALRSFFLRYESPLARLASVFILAADKTGLDWRLMPAISMVETTGGRFGTPTNVFGWNSGRTRFKTVEAGIQYVAGRFARSPIYAGKSAQGILLLYNPARKTYPPKVLRFMQELSSDPVR